MNIYMYIYHIIYHTIRLYTILDLTLLKPFLCSLYLVIMERKLNHPPPPPPSILPRGASFSALGEEGWGTLGGGRARGGVGRQDPLHGGGEGEVDPASANEE